MPNCSSFTKRKILQRLLPDCSCEKCCQLRSQSKRAESSTFNRRNKREEEVVNNEDNTVFGSTVETTKYKIFTVPGLIMPTFKFTPTLLSSFLCDLVGIISFFIIISIMFWVTVSQYLWSFAKKLLQAERNTKLIALALFIVICACITFHALISTHDHKYGAQLTEQNSDSIQPSSHQPNPPPTTVQRIPKPFHKNCHHKKCLRNNSRKSSDHDHNSPINKESRECERKIVPSAGKSIETKTPSLCDLCAAKLKTEKNVQPSLSDEEAREMYRRYKLYTALGEMKFPPSFGCVFEVLSGLFEGLSKTENRTLF